MKKILKEFLEDKLSGNQLNENFDYTFNNQSSREMFLLEFRKFLRIYNAFYYHDNRLLTIFNSHEIRISKQDLEIIFYLYLYADNNDLLYYKNIIQDFLYTYNNTINSNEYKTNCNDYKLAKDDFRNVVDSLNVRKKLFIETPNDLYLFYKEIIYFGLDNDIFIDGEIISKIFNNLKSMKKDYNELIELFITSKKHISNIIYYDVEKTKHIDVYMEYIKDSLDTFGGYNYAKEVIFELDKDNCLDLDSNNKIINMYINVTNKLVNKLKNKDYSFIQGLSEIENLKKELLYLSKNIESYQDNQKGKIQECLSHLLSLKRYIVSDNDYVKSEMHEYKYEHKVPTKEVEEYRKSLLDNKFKLYAASKINFTSELYQALESYAEHPMLSLVSKYTIDSKREVYSLRLEDRKKVNDDNFKKYFDEKGIEYTETHPKLLNKLSSNFYEELLKYLSTTFQLHQNILISTISKSDFKSIIKELKESIGYDFNNEYAIVVSNILSIEVNVIKILERNNLAVCKDGFTNLNNLFELYKDDESKVDGIMYLNYILYEKSGLNLRNNIMHGTLINEQLVTSLVVTFSGLIFISWLLNEK